MELSAAAVADQVASMTPSELASARFMLEVGVAPLQILNSLAEQHGLVTLSTTLKFLLS